MRADLPAADLTVTVGEAESEPLRLPADGRTSIGRGSVVAGLPDERWVPRQLVDILPDRHAWRFVVRRGPAQLSGDLMTGTVAEGAQLVLGPGSHVLAWDLKERVEVTVDVTVQPQNAVRARGLNRATTVMSRWHHHVRPEERRRLAIAFSHLLEQRPRDVDHWTRAAAAVSSEVSADQFRRWVRKRKERLERDLARDGRPQTFHELDDYGLWLMRHRQIGVDDLP